MEHHLTAAFAFLGTDDGQQKLITQWLVNMPEKNPLLLCDEIGKAATVPLSVVCENNAICSLWGGFHIKIKTYMTDDQYRTIAGMLSAAARKNTILRIQLRHFELVMEKFVLSIIRMYWERDEGARPGIVAWVFRLPYYNASWFVGAPAKSLYNIYGPLVVDSVAMADAARCSNGTLRMFLAECSRRINNILGTFSEIDQFLDMLVKTPLHFSADSHALLISLWNQILQITSAMTRPVCGMIDKPGVSVYSIGGEYHAITNRDRLIAFIVLFMDSNTSILLQRAIADLTTKIIPLPGVFSDVFRSRPYSTLVGLPVKHGSS